MHKIQMRLDQIKILSTRMSEEDGTDYTNLKFLSSLKNAPKKSFFKPLSLNTDLQEINQILNSPKGILSPKIAVPASLNVQMTKTFVLELLRKYETQEQAQKKWQGFINSVNSQPQFEKFVQSLKEISPPVKNEEAKPNPESSGKEDEQCNNIKRDGTLTRIYSSKRIGIEKTDTKKPPSEPQIKKYIKKDLQEIKQLLLAGQRFIREA